MVWYYFRNSSIDRFNDWQLREGKRFKIVPDFFMDLLFIGVPSAIIGARIYYVAFQWDDYKNNLWEVFMIWHGGIAIYGALIGAIIAVLLYMRAKGYRFLGELLIFVRRVLIVGQADWSLGQFYESGSSWRSSMRSHF